MTFPPGHLRLAILGDLQRDPASTVGTISERIGAPRPKVVEVTLHRLRDEGLVYSEQRGRWLITAAGCCYLENVRSLVAD